MNLFEHLRHIFVFFVSILKFPRVPLQQKHIYAIFSQFLFLFLFFYWAPVNGYNSPDSQTSIVLFIGDGMGVAHIELGRLVEYGPEGNSTIQSFPYQSFVDTLNIDGIITDSAAAATAISTGVKTRNGRIAMNYNADISLTTILEIAQAKGYATGIVATCHLTHATPAAFMAHERNRDDYEAIAADISIHNIDILLGGGSDIEYLGSQLTTFQQKNYMYITNRTTLLTATTTPLLGLFRSGSLTPIYSKSNNSEEPSLLEMTAKAFTLLNATHKPFFLMIEGSLIDIGAHDNDAIYTAHEVITFEKAVRYIVDIAKTNPQLQVIVTADHDTGGLSIDEENLITPMPTFSENTTNYPLFQAARSARAAEISVKWSTGGHTGKKVICAGMGPNTEKILTNSHHINTFSIMREVIDEKTNPEGSDYYSGHISLIIWISVLGVIVIGSSIAIPIFLVKKHHKNN